MRMINLSGLVSMITELRIDDASKDRKLGAETASAKLDESLKLQREEADKNRERAKNDYKCHNVEAFFGIVPGPGSALGAFVTSSDEDKRAFFNKTGGLNGELFFQISSVLEDAAPVDTKGADREALGDQESEAKLLGVRAEKAKKSFETFNDLGRAGTDNLRQAIDMASQALQAEAEATSKSSGS